MRVVSEQELAGELSALAVEEPRIVAGGNFASPLQLLAVADSVLETYRLFMLNAQPGIPDRDGVTYETPFVGAGMRYGRARLEYLPVRLSLVPQLFSRSRPPDLVLLNTTPIRSGKVSLGIEVNILVAAIERTRARGGLVIAQLNRHMPYTLGDGELDLELIDLAIETDQELASPVVRAPSEVATEIGHRVARLVEDGACLQTGIGTIPDAALAALDNQRGLAVWSEMISDGVLALERHGLTDKSRPLVCSFLFGTPDLYRWVDHNPRLRMVRTETANDPGMIARQPRMVSINTALQVDLFAQANADLVDGRIYSGFGGQTDFIVGAMHSWEGQALVALPSWHAKSDASTVVPCLSGPVTSFQHSGLITELGYAPIFGRSQRTQARLIIDNIAHPDARPVLREAAKRMGLA
jgi:acyl-CoA hydrolase